MTLYASAPSNIALVKYWGKRNTQHNLPLTSSFSVTLETMRTWVAISSLSDGPDRWALYGNPKKALRVLAEARAFTHNSQPLAISIHNDFPSGAGLASSASSMAALAFALDLALNDGNTPRTEVARWARLGSGSAVRSLYPGFVLWEAGLDPEGRDCIAQSRFPASQLPLDLIACVVDDRTKPIGSTEAMERCRDTSPSYIPFHARNAEDLQRALLALQTQNLQALGQVSEENCLAMHTVMHQAQPPIDYFQDGTHAAIATVRALRQQGLPCFFTIDAGPNVKVLCPPTHTPALREALEHTTGVTRLLFDRVSDSAARREPAWPAHLPAHPPSTTTPLPTHTTPLPNTTSLPPTGAAR